MQKHTGDADIQIVFAQSVAKWLEKRKNRPTPADAERPTVTADARDDGAAGFKSARFEAYYKMQHIVPPEEWDTFIQKAVESLPVTFRLAGSRVLGHEINDLIRDVHVPALRDALVDGEHIEPPKVIPWYPGGLAWQFNVEKRVLRKSPEIKKFHRFLVYETENGNVSRQEAVSMLPPLFLDVEPHHKVLDMCAAPGSKTAQLVEALHADDLTLGTSTPSGVIIANDSNHKRAQLLVHQLSRLPTPSLMVTNLDASILPTIYDARRRPIFFDRILCDVPCSGDGTTRKNPGIWKQWAPMNGVGLHSLQVRILMRALKLLDHNGRIVYSTCSLNPMENEAVVASVLSSSPDFELVDVSDRLPELIRRPGMSSWKVVNQQMEVFETYDAYLDASKSTKMKGTQLTPSHFPPKDIETLHLDRCMRVYPHLQDTGGFFVAVIQKKADRRPTRVELTTTGGGSEPTLKRALSAEVELEPEYKRARLAEESNLEVEEDAQNSTSDDVAPSTLPVTGTESKTTADAQVPASSEGPVQILPPKKPTTNTSALSKKEAKDITFSEMPYTFLDAENTVLGECIKRLGFISSFPADRVFVRNPAGHAARAMYMCNAQVKALILANEYQRIRLVHAGVKILEKQDTAGLASFRILEDGIAPLLPFVTQTTILDVDLNVLRILLEEYYPATGRFADPFSKLFETLELGNHLLRFPAASTDGATLTHSVILPLWKSGVSVCLMIDKKSKSAMSFRVFGEDITPVGVKLREQAEAKAEADESSMEPTNNISVEDSFEDVTMAPTLQVDNVSIDVAVA